MSLATCNPTPSCSPHESCPTIPFHVNVFYKATALDGKIRKPRTNCRSVDIPVLYPTTILNSYKEVVANQNSGFGTNILVNQALGNASPTLTTGGTRIDIPTSRADVAFQETVISPSLLTLPLELRLEIYSYLLPSQTHSIITQLPYNGLYYSSKPEYSTQSLYPPVSLPPTSRPNLTTYSILHRKAAMYPEVLRVCKQIYEEAEPVLYGSKGVTFDFTTHLDAVIPFLQDRSPHARQSIKKIQIAMDIPKFSFIETNLGAAVVKSASLTDMGRKWEEICQFFGGMTRLKTVDLNVWGAFGKRGEGLNLSSEGIIPLIFNSAPMSIFETNIFHILGEQGGADGTLRKTSDEEIREWEWVEELLSIDGLRNVQVAWHDFGDQSAVDGEDRVGFESWRASRMINNTLCA